MPLTSSVCMCVLYVHVGWRGERWDKRGEGMRREIGDEGERGDEGEKGDERGEWGQGEREGTRGQR